jgi:hypothetical protein
MINTYFLLIALCWIIGLFIVYKYYPKGGREE